MEEETVEDVYGQYFGAANTAIDDSSDSESVSVSTGADSEL